MTRAPLTIFTHKKWTPSAFQRLSGLSPVAVRDLRRRGLAPESEGGKLGLEAVAELHLLSALTSHGFGPKSVRATAKEFADAVQQHALANRSAWTDDKSHAAWLGSSFGKRKGPRFILIESAEKGGVAIDDPTALPNNTAPIVTIIDLERLGKELSEHMAHHPSRLAPNSGGGVE